MDHTIRTDILINASPERVWSILLDFEKYPQWNSFITNIEGTPAVGETLAATFSLPDRDQVRICPKVLVCNANEELRWMGRPGGIPCVATGEHYFQLETVSEGVTRFCHGEKLFGIIVPFMGAVWENAEEAFVHMNTALKERAESMMV